MKRIYFCASLECAFRTYSLSLITDQTITKILHSDTLVRVQVT